MRIQQIICLSIDTFQYRIEEEKSGENLYPSYIEASLFSKVLDHKSNLSLLSNNNEQLREMKCQ